MIVTAKMGCNVISLSKMKEWFENQTEGNAKKVRFEIQKRVDSIKVAMNDLQVSAKDFEVKDAVDAETRSAQNIYEKMTEMVQEFMFPENITYFTALELSKELEKFLEHITTMGRRFIPNLKKKYKTRLYILNRAVVRVDKNTHELKDFLENKTQYLQEIDDTSNKITILMEKIKSREEAKTQIKNESLEIDKLRLEITKMDSNAIDKDSKKILNRLDEINKNIVVVGNKIKMELSGLDKPLRKLTSRAQDGSIMVPPSLVEFANALRDEPIDALLQLEQGHEKLNELLAILIDASNENKFKLKPSMNTKTISISEGIINGSIKDLHDELLSLKNEKIGIDNKIKELGLNDKIQEFKLKQEDLVKNEERKKRMIKDLQDNLSILNNDIATLAADAQKQIKVLTTQDVKINIID